MLDGSKRMLPRFRGLPLRVTVPLTLTFSLDDETDGVPPPQPHVAARTVAAIARSSPWFRVRMDNSASLLLGVRPPGGPVSEEPEDDIRPAEGGTRDRNDPIAKPG